jgi:hypothetical protein
MGADDLIAVVCSAPFLLLQHYANYTSTYDVYPYKYTAVCLSVQKETSSLFFIQHPLYLVLLFLSSRACGTTTAPNR